MFWSKLELKVPPVAVAFLAGVLIEEIAVFTPGWGIGLSAAVKNVLFGVAFLFGALCALAGVWQFKRAKTTVNPHRPDKVMSLVSGGIYTYTRNPMYLGMLSVLVGVVVLLGNIVSLLILPVFVMYLNRFQILPEERALMQAFGQDYRDYQTRVRRWI